MPKTKFARFWAIFANFVSAKLTFPNFLLHWGEPCICEDLSDRIFVFANFRRRFRLISQYFANISARCHYHPRRRRNFGKTMDAIRRTSFALLLNSTVIKSLYVTQFSVLFTSIEYLKNSISWTPELKVSLIAFLVSFDTSSTSVIVPFMSARISSNEGIFCYENKKHNVCLIFLKITSCDCKAWDLLRPAILQWGWSHYLKLPAHRSVVSR